MKMKGVTLTKAMLKAVIRRRLQAMQDSVFAAAADAGFDAGEWSGPAHDEMLNDVLDALLIRFSPPQRAVIERAEQILLNEGHLPGFRYTQVLEVRS